MSIRVGLYDFFAYTIPGGLYLFTIAYLSIILGWVKIDFQILDNLSVIQVGVLIALGPPRLRTACTPPPGAEASTSRWCRL